MPRLDDDLTDDEPPGQAIVPVPQAIVPVPAPQEHQVKKASVGRGRWGNAVEKHAVALAMREGKARKRLHQAQAKSANLEQQLAVTLQAGTLWTKMLQAGFTPNMRAANLSKQLNSDKRSIRRHRISVGLAILERQRQLLKCLRTRAEEQPPSVVAFRLAWDETRQRLTMTIKDSTVEGAYHIMVVRLRLYVCSLAF